MYPDNDVSNMSSNSQEYMYNTRGKSREAAVPHINPSNKMKEREAL